MESGKFHKDVEIATSHAWALRALFGTSWMSSGGVGGNDIKVIKHVTQMMF